MSESKMITINVTQHQFDRLEKDRKHFEKVIQGGEWTISNALNEWIKIMDSNIEGNKK